MGIDVVDVGGGRAGVVERQRRSPATPDRPRARAPSGGGRPRSSRSRPARPSTVAPRSAAASASSSTTIPAPSPITNPSRRRSNGREIPVGDSACIELKHANPKSVSVASAPPQTTASASPYWIIRSAGAKRVRAARAGRHDAVALAAKRVLHRHRGRRRVGHVHRDPERRDHLARLARACMSSWVSIVDWPPIPVAITQPIRSGSYGGLAVPPGLRDRLARGDRRRTARTGPVAAPP